MKYANIIYNDLVNSDGVALTFYCQGCPHHCKGCFNSELWDFEGGNDFTADIMYDMFSNIRGYPYNNLVLLGGEPFSSLEENLIITEINIVEGFNLKVWCYTGYEFEAILRASKNSNQIKTLLERIDVLINGRFQEKLTDPKLKFRGSANQRIIDVQKSLEANKVILIDEYMS